MRNFMANIIQYSLVNNATNMAFIVGQTQSP